MSDDPYIEIENLNEEIGNLRWEIVVMGWNFMEFAPEDQIVFGRNENGEVCKMWYADEHDDKSEKITDSVWMTDLGIFKPTYFMHIPTNLPLKFNLKTLKSEEVSHD